MAGTKKEVISIAVTGGDAIPTNRLSGKSNTGTYFVCSMKNWGEYKNYFNMDKAVSYKLDLNRIAAYKELFVHFFFSEKDKYLDGMCNFENICDSLLSNSENPIIEFELRINQPRIFLKFVDNQKEIEYALRGIIYSDLTNLIFDKANDTFYLEINFNEVLKKKQSEESGVFYDNYD